MLLKTSEEVQEYLDQEHSTSLRRYLAAGQNESVSEILGLPVWQVTAQGRQTEQGEFSSLEGGNYYVSEDGVLFSVPVRKSSEEEFKTVVSQAYQNHK